MSLVALVCLALPAAFGGTLFDVALNSNGVYADGVNPTLAPLSSTINPATGLGTITYTYNPGAPGSYFMALALDYDVVPDVPFNEYGGASGTPVAGQSWQIDVTSGDLYLDANFTSTLFTNTQNNTLDNTNHVPGTTDNSFYDCGANGGGAVDPTCNTDVAFGMGFGYTLGMDEKAVITFNITDTAPASGFYLWQTHPEDYANPTPQTVYLTGNVSIQPTNGQVPEPASWLLVGPAALIGLGAFRRKLAGKQA
jgi:hypothetical protein